MFFLVVIVGIFTKSNGNTIYAPVGGNAYFSWRLLPIPTLNEPIWIVGKERQRLFYFSNTTARATETYKDRLEFIGYTYGEDIQFILNDVNMSDSGIYSSLYAGGTFAGQELVVLYKPDTPCIDVLIQPVINQSLSLNCSIQEVVGRHNTTLSVQWEFFSDDFIDRNITYSGSQVDIWPIELEDNGKNVSCRVYEIPTLLSDEIQPYIIDVHHGPLTIKLTTTETIIRVSAGSILPDIACTSLCNPPCRYKWYKEGIDIVNGHFLSLENFDHARTEHYTCVAYNQYGRIISETIVIQFKVHPSIEVLQQPNVNGGMSLNCSYKPTTRQNKENITFSWNIDKDIAKNRTIVYNGSHIVIKVVKIEDTGRNISCRIFQNGSSFSEESLPYTIDVHHGPQTVKLTTTHTLISVVEGTSLPGIACSSLCNPNCYYKWYKDGVQIVNGHFLTLGEIDEMKTGNYTCAAYNLYGTKESDTIEIEIEEYNFLNDWGIIVICTSGTVVGLIIFAVFILYCVKRRKRKRWRKESRAELQAISEKLAIRQPRRLTVNTNAENDTSTENRLNQEPPHDYIEIIDSFEPEQQTSEKSEVETYDDIIQIISDEEELDDLDKQHKSYEELELNPISEQYHQIKVDTEMTEKLSKLRRFSSGSYSNMADDERSSGSTA